MIGEPVQHQDYSGTVRPAVICAEAGSRCLLFVHPANPFDQLLFGQPASASMPGAITPYGSAGMPMYEWADEAQDGFVFSSSFVRIYPQPAQ